jgi:hypothetical protein
MDDEYNNLYDIDDLDTGELELEADDIPEYDEMDEPFDEI